ncbi:NAD-dependent epimerase/dehydratase family protein [Ascidiimonas sp. W6]|uniref:NAD-dependent epimerase/dehydratase family protein n=1 Tax=Ascidiimonas meishanensis TaxID=3128903 RepID=UPI0030ED2069
MVTGANAYVANWLVKNLLDEGLTVHTAVINLNNKKKIAHLIEVAEKAEGAIKFFESDLLKNGSYKKAMEDCELFFYTASPITFHVKDAQKELIDPAVLGTENVLNSANEVHSVKKVVLPSSSLAMVTYVMDTINNTEDKLTEKLWNETTSLGYQPYAYSKTLAKKRLGK